MFKKIIRASDRKWDAVQNNNNIIIYKEKIMKREDRWFSDYRSFVGKNLNIL